MKKKALALLMATTMVMGLSMTTQAATGTGENATGTTITGEGDMTYVDTTVYSVTIPTTAALDLIVDPQGLTGMDGETASSSDLAAYAGKITCATLPVINNQSSVPMKVTVDLQMTGDATYVDAEADVEADTSNNVLFYAVPSAVDVKGSADNFKDSATGIVMTKDAAVSLSFILPAAQYNYTKTVAEGTGAVTYGYAIAADETGHGTALKFGGLINKKADWTAYVAETDPKTIGMTAVFKFTSTIATEDVADSTEGAPYAMKAYTGTTVTVTPADVQPEMVTEIAYTLGSGNLVIPYVLGTGDAKVADAITDIAFQYAGAFYSINGSWNSSADYASSFTIEEDKLVVASTWMDLLTAGETYSVYVEYDDDEETYEVITVTVASAG